MAYDDLSEVPDSIEIQDNSGHFEDYNSNIEKNNAPSESGEIDSGDIEVESKAPSSSSSSSSSDSQPEQAVSAKNRNMMM